MKLILSENGSEEDEINVPLTLSVFRDKREWQKDKYLRRPMPPNCVADSRFLHHKK